TIIVYGAIATLNELPTPETKFEVGPLVGNSWDAMKLLAPKTYWVPLVARDAFETVTLIVCVDEMLSLRRSNPTFPFCWRVACTRTLLVSDVELIIMSPGRAI